ncbi:hypothetical protein GGI00_000276 [Coemansia sp. RSA 2681]|nr:hypothetical protein GGI00_000276 [Coemansia sp. RSA 2681]
MLGLGLHDFVLRHVVGRGAFGKVRVVEHVETRRSYALKYISKAQCEAKHGSTNILQERAILEEISHAYVASLRFSFQTTQHVFLVLDLMQGGDLRFHMRQHKRFSENVVRIWVAQLASALHYLHSVHGIVHRDIKPENVLMDHEGHVALTDFNAAVRVTELAPLHCGVAGTTSYMAPELISGGEYAGSVDWWSLGVLMYECVFGRRPFRRMNRADVKRAILEDDASFPVTTDARVSLDCISAIRGLLQKAPDKRLGCCQGGGFDRLKAHPFFASVDWDALESRDITPLFVPDTSNDNFDKTRVNASHEASSAPDGADKAKGEGEGGTVGGGAAKGRPKGLLDCEFANFNYIEYLTFKAYVEQHGAVTAEAVADAVRASSDPPKAPSPLLQLRLDGRPIIQRPPPPPPPSSRNNKPLAVDPNASSASLVGGGGGGGGSGGKSVRRRITTRAVSRLKRMNPSMISLNHPFHSSNSQASDDTLVDKKAGGEGDEEEDPDLPPPPPSNVPIDAAAWKFMLPSQKALAIRFSAKISLDRQTASLLAKSKASSSSSSSRISSLNPTATVSGCQLRHWPSMTGAKDHGAQRLAPIAAQWKAPPTRRGVETQAQAPPPLVHKTNYPQLNSDPVIVAMADEIAADGWEVIPKSAALSAKGPWSIMSPKMAGFGEIAIL